MKFEQSSPLSTPCFIVGQSKRPLKYLSVLFYSFRWVNTNFISSFTYYKQVNYLDKLKVLSRLLLYCLQMHTFT
ncbi:hypothetical protein SSIL_0910 [Solibacillus silvestris StLB046]|uniref:Uncharacterized protein n=1 Tax=Solibacillus silvestris (strain StLB046) TaxID=1002809 RepID=F2F282_SOLSS|nr:hypothetical protein SSIL_0910 [Solibacillus silvestris StLB046]